MKKVMFMLAVAASAATMQAATFNWVTSSKLYGVTAASVTDNGNYAAASSGTTDRGDKVLTLNYVLTIMDAATDAVVGSASGTVTYGSLGKVGTPGIDVTEAAQGTAYKYTLALSGTQSNLSGRGEDTTAGFDYSSAIISTTMSGNITTAIGGDTDLGNIVPTSWTVSGITPIATPGPGPGPSPIPEPTSGLLLVVGGAMLALRRKQK